MGRRTALLASLVAVALAAIAAWRCGAPLTLSLGLAAPAADPWIARVRPSPLREEISIPELTFQARRINVDSFRVVEAWMAATVLYVSTSLVIAAGLRRLERGLPKF